MHHFEKWCLSDGGETWWWMILGTGNKMRLYYENKFPEKKNCKSCPIFLVCEGALCFKTQSCLSFDFHKI